MNPAQPLPATRPQVTASPSDSREFHRILRAWENLAAQAAIAAAHRHSGVAELLDRQLRIERELATRHGEFWSPIEDDAIVWESTLLHIGTGGTERTCLDCRRAQQGLPADITGRRGDVR